MILTGMGPVDVLRTEQGKLFASLYALFSEVVFLVTASILVAPVARRMLHRLHLEAAQDEDGLPSTLVGSRRRGDRGLWTALACGRARGPIPAVEVGPPGRMQVVQAIAASLLGLAAAQLIGHVYFRPRPFAAVPGLHLLLGRSPEASFPSGHAVVSAALASFVGNGSPKWTAAWTLVAVIGVGRVYAATHYPSDILGGIALGTVSAWFSRWFSTRIIARAGRARRPS
jgi:membrane-associated phospholipid phosphatase